MTPRAPLLMPLWLAAACGGGPTAARPNRGAVAIAFTAPPAATAPLALSHATLDLAALALFGDVQPQPGVTLPDVTVDALAAAPPLELSGLPQGVYSRLRFSVAHLALAGHWRDHPLTVALDGDDQLADLRATAGRELGPGQTIDFAVAVDVPSWFAGVDLDQADIAADQGLYIDDTRNRALGSAVLAALPPSFRLTTP